jgi:hypothetical protein
MVEVRYFDDDVLVLVEDNYGKTFRSFTPDEFLENFGNVVDLLRYIADECEEMNGSFYVTPDTDEVVLECASSLEVYGFNGDPSELSFNRIRDGF